MAILDGIDKATVRSKLQLTDGVESVLFDKRKAQAKISYVPEVIGPRTILKRLEKAATFVYAPGTISDLEEYRYLSADPASSDTDEKSV